MGSDIITNINGSRVKIKLLQISAEERQKRGEVVQLVSSCRLVWYPAEWNSSSSVVFLWDLVSQMAKSVFTLWWDIFGLNGRSGKVWPLPQSLLGAKRVSGVPAAAPAACRKKRWDKQARLSLLSQRPLVLSEFRGLNQSHRYSAGVNCSRVHWWGNRSSSHLCPWLWPRLCTPVYSCRCSGPAAGLQSPEGRRRIQIKPRRLTLLMLMMLMLLMLPGPN